MQGVIYSSSTITGAYVARVMNPVLPARAIPSNQKAAYNIRSGTLSAPPYSLSVRTTAYLIASALATSARAALKKEDTRGSGQGGGRSNETFVVFAHPVQQLALTHLQWQHHVTAEAQRHAIQEQAAMKSKQ